MKILEDYLILQQEIYEYFGYVEDWVVFPIQDCRDYFWRLDSEEVIFHEEKENLDSDGNYYSYEIYKQRFLKKWVYEGPEFTMIVSDTHVDGNKFLAIFDNSKKVD